MSADNYYLIRRYKGRYLVTNESASVDTPTPRKWAVKHGALSFVCLEDARTYALSQYSEYGVTERI